MKRKFIIAVLIFMAVAVVAASCAKTTGDTYDRYKGKVLTGYVTGAEGSTLSVLVDFEMENDDYRTVISYVKSLSGASGDSGNEQGSANPGEEPGEPTPFVIELPEIPLSGARKPGDAWKTGRMAQTFAGPGLSTRKVIELPPDELDDGSDSADSDKDDADKETVKLNLPSGFSGKFQKDDYVAVIFDADGKISAVETIDSTILQLFKLFALVKE